VLINDINKAGTSYFHHCFSLILLLCANRVEHDYYKYHPMAEVRRMSSLLTRRTLTRHSLRLRDPCILTPQIADWMTRVAKENPDVVTTMAYGRTYEKRSISLLKVDQLCDPLSWDGECVFV